MDESRSHDPQPEVPATRPPQPSAVQPATPEPQKETPPRATRNTAAIATDLTPAESREFPAIPGYEILGILGHGGMGIVYRARQLKANRLVALKMIRAIERASPHDRLRFQIETEAVARLQHPNIVQLYEVGEIYGQPFFSLEFCDGGTLDARLKKSPLTPREAAELIEVLARAMHYAHLRGVVHRDLKPANVLLAGEPGGVSPGSASGAKATGLAGRLPKISDFGLAKRTDAEARDVSLTGVVMGTPSYMAPEQAAGRVRDTGPGADVYALGALLYMCLTQRPPFVGANNQDTLQQVLNDEPAPPSRLASQVPRDLETICLKCLRKEPEQRYPDAEALADDLRRYLDGKPVQARPVGRTERFVKWARRRPAAAGLLAAMLLLTVLIGVLFVVDYGRRASDEQRARAEKASGEADEQRRRAEDLQVQEEKQRREAETLRDRAVGLQAEEEKQRLRAEAAEKEQRKQRERAEGLVYAGQLAQAQSAWEEGDARAARSFLYARRWDYRGWEYAHLRQRFDETQVTLRGHTSLVMSVIFSPDGKRLASGGNEGTVKVWDAGTGQELLSLEGHFASIGNSICFSPDGNRLASASKDRSVKIFDAATGQELLAIKGYTGDFRRMSFSPDGKHLAIASNDQTARVWDAATGQEHLALKGHTKPVFSVSFSPDGKRLATTSHDNTVKIWDAATGKVLLNREGQNSLVLILQRPRK